jgi:hypothetical protein
MAQLMDDDQEIENQEHFEANEEEFECVKNHSRSSTIL